MILTNSISCPICSASSNDALVSQPEDFEYRIKLARQFTIRRCNQCRGQFVWPRPGIKEIISFYPEEYHAYNEDHGGVASVLVAMRNRVRSRQYREIAQDDVINLFDVGTGDCRHFTDLASRGNYYLAGVEINPDMVKNAKENGFDIYQGTLEEMDIGPYENKFDIVTMYQLVEHVLEPNVLFEKAHYILKPGGYVLGQLPCIDSWEYRIFKKYWAGYHFPRHLQMLSKSGLCGLLEKCGFKDVNVSSALHLQAALSMQNLLVDKFFYSPKLTYGKLKGYSALLLLLSPFCFLEHLVGRGGMMNFTAKKNN